jgi:DNA-binding MarR family transcriptional regulator
LARPSVGGLVDKVEGRCLVLRERVAGDGWAVLVSILEEGWERLDAARGEIRSLLRQTLFELDHHDMAALTRCALSPDEMGLVLLLRAMATAPRPPGRPLSKKDCARLIDAYALILVGPGDT